MLDMPYCRGPLDQLGSGLQNTRNGNFGPVAERLTNKKAVKSRATTWFYIVNVWDVRGEQIDIPGLSGSHKVLRGVKFNTQNSHFGPHIGPLENANADRRRAKT